MNQTYHWTMDSCLIDVTIEFLAVAFHNILYYASVYPKSVFETRKKYNVIVYHSTHPEVNQYIDLCLKSVRECLKNDQLSRVDFVLTDSDYKPMVKFVFGFMKNHEYNDTLDAYLIKAEMNLRAFCLKLSTLTNKFQVLPENSSFSIYLYTNESTAVSMATNTELEDFPLVELQSEIEETNGIIPLRRISIKNLDVDTYVEM